MKKFFSALLGVAMIASLAACNKGPSVDWTKVWTDESTEGYVLCGPSQNSVGDSTLDWSYKAENVLTAASLNDVKAVDEQLAKKISGYSLKGLYMVSGVKIGYTAAGYNKAGYDGQGKLVNGDGSLTIKVCNYSTDEETGVTAVNTWFPSPEGYSASLTPSVWQEQRHSDTADENGIDHNSDVLMLGGSGVYTIVMAHFAKQITANDGVKVNYAYGAVLQQANEEGQKVSEVISVPVESVGAIGKFAASENWAKDVALTKEGDAFVGTIEVAAEDQFKVRANGSWDYSWGFSNLTPVPNAADFVDAGGNIGAVKGGTVKITIQLPAQLSVVKNSPVLFKVEFVTE